MTQDHERPASGGATIAIIDDDDDLRGTMTALLDENGFTPLPLPGADAYRRLDPPPNLDLALIDLNLAGESGLELAMEIRDRLGIPIVMLTGWGTETDRIEGLETGADDYLMKPFNPRELLARLRAVLRRSGWKTPAPDRSGHQLQTFGTMTLDLTRRELLAADGGEIPLTNGEYRLLEYLVRNRDRIIPRVELLGELGSDLSTYVDRTIDVLILRLRRKIEAVPSKPVYLQTRRGQGYIFVTTSRSEP
ncbi:Transcriptional regulatory protein OmpR [uncultured Pleomorphomonas sp.]|uniref:Transcriptional regulatory protein OmpR n=1 Tax=uncultured Pleomorphomonas sp. TaxID=442121 RepID=A0A212L8T3_9HYPH|nr:response regulator transcription factor [uncultured Pleomorphomonas sp.]SCM73897.1 Transcriptional regulatory protein OmpR [uncultured Pleomorphomonas sp.]